MSAPPVTAGEALAALRDRELGALELLETVIARVESTQLGAVDLLDADGARRQARRAESELARGDGRSLSGLPILVKDVIDVAGLPTRGGTARWCRRPERDGDCVAALRAAGAVVIGKGHTNELAFGIDGRNPHRPPCLNPHDKHALPGGSSSGPAVAIGGGLALGALGTDTSGSIRVPAALCGIAGLRPTHGLLSLRGVLPLAPSYDVVGPLAPCVADLRTLFTALLAAASGPRALVERVREESRRPTIDDRGGATAIARVGVLEQLLDPAVCEPAVAAAVRDAAAALARLGLTSEPVSVPELDGVLAVHRDVQVPEAAASVQMLGVPEHELGAEVRERVRSAREIGPERHLHALRERERIAGAIAGALPLRGVLLAPGCPVPAPSRDAREWRSRSGEVRSIRETLLSCTVPLTQSRGPVLSVPVTAVDGRPVGVQLLARTGEDAALLELGVHLERELAGALID